MRNFVKIGFVAVFAAVAGYGVYTSQKSEVMSDLALANVEALARGESGSDIHCCGNYGECMKVISGGESHVVAGVNLGSMPCP